jgi:hypothetical protein
MSVLALWLSNALWGWGVSMLGLGIIVGIGLLVAGSILAQRHIFGRKR